MRFSDGGPAARALAGGPGRSRPAADLSAEARALWTALSGPPVVEVREEPLPGDGFWAGLYVREEAPGSQMDALLAATAAGLALSGPVAAVADRGRGFHGLRGRAWAAESGNLHFCAALPLAGFPAARSLALTLLPAVAARDAVIAATGGAVAPGLKWVNDLVLDRRKVGGVLTSTRVSGDRTELAVLGIGLNAAFAPDVPPTPFVPAAGRIPGTDAPALLAAVLSALARRARELLEEGPGPLLEAYRSSSAILGRRVRVYPEGLDDRAPPDRWPAPVAAGRLLGIGDDLSLEIEGVRARVGAGRLALEDACREHGLPPPPNPDVRGSDS